MDHSLSMETKLFSEQKCKCLPLVMIKFMQGRTHTPLYHKLKGNSVAVQTPELIPEVLSPLAKMRESAVLTNTLSGLVQRVCRTL